MKLRNLTDIIGGAKLHRAGFTNDYTSGQKYLLLDFVDRDCDSFRLQIAIDHPDDEVSKKAFEYPVLIYEKGPQRIEERVEVNYYTPDTTSHYR